MYTVTIERAAQRALEALPERDYQRVVAAIMALANNPRPTGCTKLKGRDAWRIRVGDYRVIYEIDDPQRLVVVVVIAHRREAYR